MDNIFIASAIGWLIAKPLLSFTDFILSLLNKFLNQKIREQAELRWTHEHK